MVKGWLGRGGGRNLLSPEAGRLFFHHASSLLSVPGLTAQPCQGETNEISFDICDPRSWAAGEEAGGRAAARGGEVGAEG